MHNYKPSALGLLKLDSLHFTSLDAIARYVFKQFALHLRVRQCLLAAGSMRTAFHWAEELLAVL